jgi:hypothetical protein
MLHQLKYLLLLALVFATLSVNAQTAEELSMAEASARRLQDSLHLSQDQRQRVVSIHARIYMQKGLVTTRFAGSDSLAYRLQQVEKQREPSYKLVFTREQFERYLQIKNTLQ